MVFLSPNLETFYSNHFQKLYDHAFESIIKELLCNKLHERQFQSIEILPIWYYWMSRYMQIGYGHHSIDSGLSLLFAFKFLKSIPDVSPKLQEQCRSCINSQMKRMILYERLWRSTVMKVSPLNEETIQHSREIKNQEYFPKNTFDFISSHEKSQSSQSSNLNNSMISSNIQYNIQYEILWERIREMINSQLQSFEDIDDGLCTLVTKFQDQFAFYLHTLFLGVMGDEWKGTEREKLILDSEFINSNSIDQTIRMNLLLLAEKYNFQLAKNTLGVIEQLGLFSTQWISNMDQHNSNNSYKLSTHKYLSSEGQTNSISSSYKYFFQTDLQPRYIDSTYNFVVMKLEQGLIEREEAIVLLSTGHKEKHGPSLKLYNELLEKSAMQAPALKLHEEFDMHIITCFKNQTQLKVEDQNLGKWLEISKFSHTAAYIVSKFLYDNTKFSNQINSKNQKHASLQHLHNLPKSTSMGLLHFASSDPRHQMSLIDLSKLYSGIPLDSLFGSENIDLQLLEELGIQYNPKMSSIALWRGITQDETHPLVLYLYIRLIFKNKIRCNTPLNIKADKLISYNKLDLMDIDSETSIPFTFESLQNDPDTFLILLKLSVDMGLQLKQEDEIFRWLNLNTRNVEQLIRGNQAIKTSDPLIQNFQNNMKITRKPNKRILHSLKRKNQISKVFLENEEISNINTKDTDPNCKCFNSNYRRSISTLNSLLNQKNEPFVNNINTNEGVNPTMMEENQKVNRLELLISKAVTHYEKEEFQSAFPIIHQLVTINDVERLYFPLAFMYDNGFGIEKNPKLAIRYYKKAFHATDSRYAAHNLGVIYQHTIRDVEEAKYWYFKSIENWGYSNSYFNLAVLFKDEGDYKTARELYQKAAAQKHDGALNNLGTLLEEGKGGSIDIEGAFECYMLAAKMNNKYALKNASGYLLERGQVDKAIEYLEASAAQGFDPAMKRLGDIYDCDEYGVKNVVLATQWYAKGAQANNPDCYFKLGYAHQTGRGIKRCLKKAAHYYRISIKMTDSSPAKHNLAIILSAEKQYSEAAKLYESAIGNGYTLSANNLARLYRYGNGVAECYQSALHYYRLGHQHGHADSTNGLGTMYEKGLGVQKDMKMAFKYYLEAAQSMYPYGLFNVGLCYENGSAVEKDIVIALKLYTLAAQRGHDQSRLRASNLILTYRNESVSGNL